MGYANPLLSLPSAKLVLAHPLQKRLMLSVLFRQVRAEANEKAEAAWARRQHHAGAFWRATSTYARHVALLLCEDNPLKAKPSKLGLPRVAAATVKYRNPLLNLTGTKAILNCAPEDRRLLALLFNDLSTASRLEWNNSWKKRKAPMALYWVGCEKHARRIARLLEKPEPLAGAAVAPADVSDLGAWLSTLTDAAQETEQCAEVA